MVIQAIILQYIPSPEWLSILLVGSCAFLSHFILDTLSTMTYHPSVRVPGKFWVIWHLFVYGFGFILILIYFQAFWLGILAANAVDIWDWYILRTYAKYKNDPSWGKRYYLHSIKDRYQKKYFGMLPNYNHLKLGILPELLVYFAWFLVVIFTF